MSLFGPRILLLDSGSLTAQSFRVACSNDDTSNDKIIKPKHAAAGVMVLLSSVLGMAQNGYGVPLFVNDRYPVRKLNIYASYKCARFERYTKTYTDPAVGNVEVPEGEELSLHQQFRKILQPILSSLPAVQAYSPGEEADDSLKTVTLQIGRVSGTKLTVFTRDTDMFQLVGQPRVQVLYKTPDGPGFVVTPDYVRNKYPLPRADQIPLYKCFMGDAGDSVPKIARMHEKFIIKDLIGNRSCVQEIYDAWWGDQISQEGWHRGWEDSVTDWLGEDEEQRGQAFLNERLTRLREDCNMIYEYTGGDYNLFLEHYNLLAAQAPYVRMPDALQLWNHFSHWAGTLFKVFEKDGISPSNPGILTKI